MQGIKKVLLQMSTGSGKTFIFSTIMKGAQSKGNRCVMAVRGRSLVDQASKRLDEMEIDHSVFMSNDKRFDADKNIQICSIDSIRSRNYAPPANILILDEAHLATSKSFKEFLSFYPDAFWLSVTATPWVVKGLTHLAEKLVYPISFAELVEQGYLVPARYFAPTKFDTSKIKIVNGEYDDDSALLEFKKQSVYGDVVKSYREKCVGEPTFCFAINIAHANLIADYFKENSIRAVVITAKTTLVEREFLIGALTSNEIDVIISVGTMTTGVDVPALKNIILCRPTQSKNLYVQMLGRGTRIFPGKDHFKVIDHVGNVVRHGFLIDEQAGKLEPDPKKNKKEKLADDKIIGLKVKTCKSCFAVVKSSEKVCSCGSAFETTIILPDEIDSELKELNLDLRSRMKLRAEYFLLTAWQWGYQPGYIWVKLKEEFGDDAVRKHYQINRSAKAKYEGWKYEPASAPCSFAAAKAERDKIFSRMETDDGSSV